MSKILELYGYLGTKKFRLVTEQVQHKDGGVTERTTLWLNEKRGLTVEVHEATGRVGVGVKEPGGIRPLAYPNRALSEPDFLGLFLEDVMPMTAVSGRRDTSGLEDRPNKYVVSPNQDLPG